MTTQDAGTVLISGPTGGLGRAAVLAMASRPAAGRPDLLLVGRAGERLTQVTGAARAAGATVQAIGCDMARLADVRAAAEQVKELLAAGTVRPLHGLVANAGVSGLDTRGTSADGYELTFAVNYLAHAQLTGDLLGSFTAPARIVLIGSNTYHQNRVRKILHVPPAHWRDPVELAKPAPANSQPSLRAAGVAYSDSKLAFLYYAHELQRRAPAGVSVVMYEPGFMPGTGLSRQHGPAAQAVGRALERLPRIASPATSGPQLASVVLDPRWAHLRNGAFVVRDSERDVKPFAHDSAREARLWDATAELLQTAAKAGS